MFTQFLRFTTLCLCVALSCCASVAQEMIAIDAQQKAPPSVPADFRGGTSISPDGHKIGVTRKYLTLDDKPWLPVMGEFQYSRYPEDDWEAELLKMKAAGVQIVSSYVIWNQQEAIQGQPDWSGRRSLQHFSELCKRDGLYLFPRIGPWVHGEARYGGLPDWVMKQGHTRTLDPAFMASVDEFYKQIAQQLTGQLWKDGGPVIGIQIENEYSKRGPDAGAAYMMALKHMAVSAGLDVPLYTVTGWDNAIWPNGEFLPVYGGYSDAPWDSNPGKLAPNEVYLFRFRSRSSGNMGAIGKDSGAVQPSAADTPFLTAEVGAGIQDTYMRRPVVSRNDVAAIASVMIGSGANLLGYYMFQGGENPDGARTTLNESKATGYPTDVPIKSYDFQAPLGEFGLERPSYGALKLFNYFLNDFGATLAPMQVFAPEKLPESAADMQTMRVSVRADQSSGFLFVNNHVRGYSMKSHSGVQFRIALGNNSTITIPARPVAVPADSYFIWPLRMKIGSATMTYSTAQPMCRMMQGNTTVWIFSEVPGIKAEFAFPRNQAKFITSEHGTERQLGDAVVIRDLVAGLTPVISVVGDHHSKHDIVLLSRDQAAELTKLTVEGAAHLVVSRAEVFSNEHTMTLRSLNDRHFQFEAWPRLLSATEFMSKKVSDLFWEYRRDVPLMRAAVQCAPEPRRPSQGGDVVADPLSVPNASVIASAPDWRLKVSGDALANAHDVFLKINYVGDIARLSSGDKLLTDNFFNGEPWMIGLRRFKPQLKNGLQLKIVPWRDSHGLTLEPSARARLRPNQAEIVDATALPQYEVHVR